MSLVLFLPAVQAQAGSVSFPCVPLTWRICL